MWEAAGRDAVARHGPWGWDEGAPLFALSPLAARASNRAAFTAVLGVLSEAEGSK